MKNIAITTTTFGEFDPAPLEICKKRGFNVVLNPHGRKVSTDELIAIAKDAVGIVAGTENITDQAIAQLPRLKVISRVGVGIENVDVKAAERQKIKVFTTPGAPTQAVVELTVGLMLNLLRQIQSQHTDLVSGKWTKKMGNLLWRKKIGIVGLGQIGHKVAQVLKAFECEIAYTDPKVTQAAFQKKALPALLNWADLVTIHTSGSDRLIGAEEIKFLKPSACLINTSRGGVVDEEALLKFLKENRSAGAALDVFVEEPYKGPLTQLPNVLLTPHIGSYARETRIEMERQAVDNLLKGLE